MSDSLIIFLHGVGSRGAASEGLFSVLTRDLPEAAFAAPDAPYPFEGAGAGRQWFSVSGVTAANRSQRVAQARGAFDAVLQGEIVRHGFGDRLDRVVLVGFSQGAIMTLDAVASGRWTVGAAVAFSGRLATPEPLAPSTTPILLVHGTADPIMPFAEMGAAEASLAAQGAAVQCFPAQGIGHAIAPDGVRAAGRFIAQALSRVPAVTGPEPASGASSRRA